MMDFYKKLFDIRAGEGVRASLMFAYIFLVIASLMIVKPVRNSLFLVEFGAEKLPYVFVLVALFAAVVGMSYYRLTSKVRLNYLIFYTLLISISCLLLFWFLLHSGYRSGSLLYAFYVWVAIFGVVTSAQFWLLANFVFNVREAKRLFGFIGAGAIAGGIFGGYLTNYLAPKLRTENLIFFCIVFLTMCAVLFWFIWKRTAHQRIRERRHKRQTTGQMENTGNPLKLILGSRHLSYMAGITGVGVVVATLVDYQFNAVASRVITDTDRLTAFFGFWLSTLNVISLGIQLFLTSRVLRYFGVAASLFFLPIGILLGAIAIIVNPGLGSAIIVKMSDGSFKHSINKAGIELLSLPVPTEIKARVKAFIDVFVDNIATGLAGALLILLTIVLGWSVSHISAAVIFLVVFWLYMIIREKEEYVNSIRRAIENRTIDLEQQSLNLEDASVLGSLVKALDGDNERQIMYALRLLEGVKNKALQSRLSRLAGHPSDEVKAQVLGMALQYEKLDLTARADALTMSDDQAVRIGAIRYMCERSDDRMTVLNSYRNHEDYRVRGSAMMCAATAWRENKQIRSSLDLGMMLDSVLEDIDNVEDEEEKKYIKMTAAGFIGAAGNPDLFHRLGVLLKDDSREVVQIAVKNTGQTQAHEFVPELLEALATSSVRKYARDALAEYGEDVINTLADRLSDPSADIIILKEIPRVLALIRSQASVDVLFGNLAHGELSVRYAVIKALNKLRVSFPSIKIDRSLIEERLHFEVRRYYRHSGILYAQRAVASDTSYGSRARQLLVNALVERLDNNLERIFRLLGLGYTPEDMYNVYLGVTSNKPRLRADSVEFLDNVLKPDLKRKIIPVVESTQAEGLTDIAGELFGFTLPTEEESVRLLMEGDDSWLKACTLFTVAAMRQRQYHDLVVQLIEDPNRLVSETSSYYLEQVDK